jgi:transketolase
MRGHIIDSIFSKMEKNPDIFFLCADMGINLIEKFEEKYPERFANVGIAEQNLIGICAGLVNLGYRPFAYTISNFIIHRCFEQIRNDIAIHRYPITLIGTSTGYDNAPLGPTHHIIEEWGSLKSIPGIDIYCPSSNRYAAPLVERILENTQPAYIRIPKGSPQTPESEEHMVQLSGTAKNVLLISYGGPAQACIAAQKLNPELSVLVINRLRPLDERRLSEILAPYKQILVIEDHFPESGLYGSLCEFIARNPIAGKIRSLAPRDYNLEVGASAGYFNQKYGIDTDGILASIGENL